MRRKKARLERRLSYIDSLTAVPFLTQVRDTVYPGGGTLGLFGWGCAAGTLEPWNPGTLEPLSYTRASSSLSCYPVLD